MSLDDRIKESARLHKEAVAKYNDAADGAADAMLDVVEWYTGLTRLTDAMGGWTGTSGATAAGAEEMAAAYEEAMIAVDEARKAVRGLLLGIPSWTGVDPDDVEDEG